VLPVYLTYPFLIFCDIALAANKLDFRALPASYPPLASAINYRSTSEPALTRLLRCQARQHVPPRFGDRMRRQYHQVPGRIPASPVGTCRLYKPCPKPKTATGLQVLELNGGASGRKCMEIHILLGDLSK
jgi:hypothetical protein